MGEINEKLLAKYGYSVYTGRKKTEKREVEADV
jgi:hypothetical protein